jgi:hypothetical protein
MGRADKTHEREEMPTKYWKEERYHLKGLGINGECTIKMSIRQIVWEGGD